MTPMEITQAFLDSWAKMDWEVTLGMLSDDVFYHNIPMEPLVGIDAVRSFFATLPPMAAVTFDTHFIAANGNAVLTERTDRFKFGDTWVSVRVMGTFEIADGKIAKWRDYFDLAEFQSQMAALPQ